MPRSGLARDNPDGKKKAGIIWGGCRLSFAGCVELDGPETEARLQFERAVGPGLGGPGTACGERQRAGLVAAKEAADRLAEERLGRFPCDGVTPLPGVIDDLLRAAAAREVAAVAGRELERDEDHLALERADQGVPRLGALGVGFGHDALAEVFPGQGTNSSLMAKGCWPQRLRR